MLEVSKVRGLAPSTHKAGQLLAEALAHQHARNDVFGVQKAVDVLPYGYDCCVTHITHLDTACCCLLVCLQGGRLTLPW